MGTLITVPDEIRDGSLTVVASVSGGKDSTALILALREAEVPARYVFADTGWEHADTYRHLDALREVLGITIDVVGVPGGMRAKIAARAGFPGRKERWCTKELKLAPIREYHDRLIAQLGTHAHGVHGVDTVCAMGVRAEESEKRAAMAEWEDDADWGGWCWRPILRWSIGDVLAIHHRHAVPLNPLYHRGFDRVGCFPCIMAGKAEIRRIADESPETIDEIRAMEQAATLARAERNAVKPGRYSHPTATFFQAHQVAERIVVDGKKKRVFLPISIDGVVAWSRTGRGGKQTGQIVIFDEAPKGGCMRWGMCEPPSKDPEAA